jgi:hypothetical protein
MGRSHHGLWQEGKTPLEALRQAQGLWEDRPNVGQPCRCPRASPKANADERQPVPCPIPLFLASYFGTSEASCRLRARE